MVFHMDMSPFSLTGHLIKVVSEDSQDTDSLNMDNLDLVDSLAMVNLLKDSGDNHSLDLVNHRDNGDNHSLAMVNHRDNSDNHRDNGANHKEVNHQDGNTFLKC